ncbi:MAG TPA: hypothetical protein PJ986_10195 [Gammaproteobacteria bacterium]|nr:hypothetical protein [Gammaproteobacteria bacterium]
MRLRYTAVAICAGNAGAYAIVNTSPLTLGALKQGLGLDAAAAGALITAALSSMGLIAFAAAPFLIGARKRRAAVAAALVLTLAESAAALTDSGAWMTLWMLSIGLGAGLLLAAVNAIVAATANPDRLFGHALMSAYLVAALLVFGLTPAIAVAGQHGAFAVLAAFSLALLPLLRGLPHEADAWQASRPSLDAAPAQRGGLALLLGIFVIGVPMMGFYAYTEGLGARLALAPAQVAAVLAAQQLASVAGALLAARRGLRIGLRRGILGATVLHTVAIAAAVLGDTPWLYAAGVVAEGFSFLFLLPLLFTLAAVLDASGRWAAAANGALFVATGIAPALIGAVIDRHGYDAIAWLMLGATPAGLAALAVSLRALAAPGSAAIQRVA